MRTKLRLDLKDVRRQIEDLEDLLKSDKSEENVEAHRKLVEYEKKLKEQYEKMTGLSLDQASNLEGKSDVRVADSNKNRSPLSGFLALLGGLLLAYGFLNTVLYSLQEVDYLGIMDYFSGKTLSTYNLSIFLNYMIGSEGMLMMIYPLLGGSLLVLLSGFLDKSRSKIFGILEGLGFFASVAILGYTAYLSPNSDYASALLRSLFIIYTGLMVISAVFLFLGGIKHKSGFRQFLGFIVSVLFLYSAAQFYLLIGSSEVDPLLVWQWPWITLPLVLGSVIYSLIGLLRIIK